MADCTTCGSRLYPDQRSRCGHCRTRDAAQAMRSDHFCRDDEMLLVGTSRMSWPATAAWMLGTLAVFLLFGWLLGEEVPR